MKSSKYKHRTPTGRYTKRLIIAPIVFFVPVTVIVALNLIYVKPTRLAIEAELQSIRDKGLPVLVADIPKWLPPIPDGENAHDEFEAAIKSFVILRDTKLPVPILGFGEMPGRSEPWPAEMVSATGAYLDSLAACFEHLEKAAAMSHFRLTYSGRRDAFASTYWSEQDRVYRTMSSLCEALQLKALHRIEVGDSDAAVKALAICFQIGRLMRDEPTSMSLSVESDILSSSLATLEWILNRTALTENQLDALTSLVESDSTNDRLFRVVVIERCTQIELLRGTDPRFTFPAKSFPMLSNPWFLQSLRISSQSVVMSRLPSKERFRTYWQRMKESNQETYGRNFFIEAFLFQGYDIMSTHMGSFYLAVSCDTAENLAQSIIALERYRIQNGAIPESLEALVPDFLPDVPVDPYSGDKIIFRKTDSGYVVASTLWDRKNNGAIPEPEFDKNVRSGDYVVEIRRR